MDLLHVLGHARRVGGALQEGRPDVGALDTPLNVRDEVIGDRVGVIYSVDGLNDTAHTTGCCCCARRGCYCCARAHPFLEGATLCASA